MKYVEISEDLRKMTIPSTEKVLGCVGDRNVRHVYFRMPRFCDDVDLAGCRIQVHYTNADGIDDYYEVPNHVVDSQTIEFGWLVGRVACAATGYVLANIKLRSYEGPLVSKEFNSGVGRFKVKPAFSSDPYGTNLVDEDGDLIMVLLAKESE